MKDAVQKEKAKRTQKVAVFGGSFDPVTDAHLEIIRGLSKRFARVVVLPCNVSPFKQGGCSADGEDRVKMLRKVTADLENVKVSKWEIKRDKVSYSSDAVRHYKEKYPDAEISFVIGSDCLGQLPEWHEADYLAANAVFYVIARPGFPIRKAQIEILGELGFTVKRGFKGEDESSSLVRVAAAFGKTDEFLPAEVAEHIGKHNLYNDYTPFTRAFKTFGMKNERIEHTFRAVKAGIKLAKIHGEDVDSVITALILHDIGKYADRGSLLNNNVHVSDDVYKLPSPVIHAHVSAAIARDYFHVSDEIVTAIKRHTTGSAGMTALDKIVYLADATEEGRGYEEAPKIAKIAAKDLDRAMRRALKLSIAEVKKNGNTLHVDTAEAYAYFRTLCATRVAEAKAAPVFAPKSDKADKKGKQENGKKSEKAKVKDLSESKALASFIAACLSEKKGKDVVLINVGQRTVIADYFVVCGATSTTAVRALADYVDEKLSKDHGIEPLRRDVNAKWAVIDYGHVILHVFHEEAREFYRLEKLWDFGDNVTHYED